jgi:hypothetical protein
MIAVPADSSIGYVASTLNSSPTGYIPKPKIPNLQTRYQQLNNKQTRTFTLVFYATILSPIIELKRKHDELIVWRLGVDFIKQFTPYA